MSDPVHSLLQFYQSEVREHQDAKTLLTALGIQSPEVIDHFGLGFCSGRAYEIASDADQKALQDLGLVYRQREVFSGRLVFPVHDQTGQLVDLHGIWIQGKDKRYTNWQKSPRGLIGIECLAVYPEIILTDNVHLAMQTRQHGHLNVVALRSPDELKSHLALLKGSQVKRVFLVARKSRQALESQLQRIGLEVICLPTTMTDGVLDAACLASVGKQEQVRQGNLKLVSKSEHRLHFSCDAVQYKVDALSLTGLGMRAQVRAEHSGTAFLDRLDLASSSARSKYSKSCAGRLMLASSIINQHLNDIATAIDEMMLDEAQQQTRRPAVLSKADEKAAIEQLRDPRLLDHLAGALNGLGIAGEDANRRLLILIAASRLLPQPLGAIIRGHPSSGKSTLIQAVSRLLPPHLVLSLSRLTPQALFYMPKESLQNTLLVVDEYAGMEDSEYSLRTMMSNQSLSLALTLRDSGKTPVTKVLEVPARMAVFVSSTQVVNIENLSRFIELRMDVSPEQTRRVLETIAVSRSEPDLSLIRNCQQVLKASRVEIPFAKKLVSGVSSVLARRRFGHLIGLVRAHAILHQMQRESKVGSVTATVTDYAAIHRLLPHVVQHEEESLSTSATDLMDAMNGKPFTVKEVMVKLGASYSKVYRVLRELESISLARCVSGANGIERVYELTPYESTRSAFNDLPAPESLGE